MHKLYTTISNSSNGTTTRSPSYSSSSSSTTSSTTSTPTNINQAQIKKNKSQKTAIQLHDIEIETRSLIQQCNKYIKENNHLGLALVARQSGLPPSLRYKIWPILLKYHPYVIAPFINATVETDSDIEIDQARIHQDILKYFQIRSPKNSDNNVNTTEVQTIHQGTSPNNKNVSLSPLEEEIISILQSSIVKFFTKWGGVVKYDSGFTWIALNLAEWFPPIPNSNYVLVGRNYNNKSDPLNKHLTQIQDPLIPDFHLDETITSSTNTIHQDNIHIDADGNSISSETTTEFSTIMTFSEVFERLVLVILHSKELETNDEIGESRRNSLKQQSLLTPQTTLNGNEIFFKTGNVENRISFFINSLNKLLPELYKLLSEEEILTNNKNNQWLTWWLKYYGAKVLNKFDRGRLWDLILGFRLDYSNYVKEYDNHAKHLKAFKKFYQSSDEDYNESQDEMYKSFDIDQFWFKPIDDEKQLKWSQIDYQYQLNFIFISMLRKNEGELLEFDQFEMIGFLNKLNYKRVGDDLSTFDVGMNKHAQSSIEDAGELWRNWLWNELRDEIND